VAFGDIPASHERVPSECGVKVYADLCSIVATGHLASRTALAEIREGLAASAPEPAVGQSGHR